MSPLPTLSVVMPTRNRLERLPSLVQTYVDQRADEVVVILDGPHEGWRELLAHTARLPGVEIHELEANRGLALARTAGLERARGDIVLIADDDVIPEPGLIDRHRAFHAEHLGHALLGYMPVALPERRGRDQAATFIYARDYENQVALWRESDSVGLLESFWGGNASLPRELYLRAEKFKPSQRLDYNEDLDLGLRLREVGAQAAFDELAKSMHQHSRDFASFTRECVIRGQAVFDLESRWERLPEQLLGLVQIPPTHNRLAAALQRRIGTNDSAGLIEAALGVAYRASGTARAWTVQDTIARFLRRGLAIRGYRMAHSRRTLA
ncbi:MAG: glycosyltransferase [Microbacteriaceae bacterium]|jgi:glycosyltransferase involved in cell wall biosynthesis|nr:glycosyltransferase [Microbacteriaceae bacterium]